MVRVEEWHLSEQTSACLRPLKHHEFVTNQSPHSNYKPIILLLLYASQSRNPLDPRSKSLYPSAIILPSFQGRMEVLPGTSHFRSSCFLPSVFLHSIFLIVLFCIFRVSRRPMYDCGISSWSQQSYSMSRL